MPMTNILAWWIENVPTSPIHVAIYHYLYLIYPHAIWKAAKENLLHHMCRATMHLCLLLATGHINKSFVPFTFRTGRVSVGIRDNKAGHSY